MFLPESPYYRRAQITGRILVCVCTYFSFDLPVTFPDYQADNVTVPVQNPLATRSISLGQVSRERVAQTLVHLVERPRREVYLGRLYDVPAIMNKLFPWTIDLASSIWVRLKQAKELKKGQKEQPPP